MDNNISNQNNPVCKFCQSPHVIKYGTEKGTQYYMCRDCNHKFARADTIPRMQNTTKDIADALNMYYEGMSLNEIRRNFIQQDENYISKVSPYNWVQRFTELATKEADKYTPKVGDTWVADETFIRIDKSKSRVENPYDKSRSAKWIVFWDIIDADTRFLLASHIATTRGKEDARILMEKAAKRAGKVPKVVVTDKLGSYLDGIELAYGSEAKHKQGSPFEIENNNNLIERFHGTLKERTKVMRALKNKDTLQKFTDGWLIHYNYFRPHMSLSDKTPAEMAGIKFPFRNWKDVVEQPYEKTSRMKIKTILHDRVNALTASKSLPKTRQPRISAKVPRITPKTPSITKQHYARRGGGITRRGDL
jgi:putative transposase